MAKPIRDRSDLTPAWLTAAVAAEYCRGRVNSGNRQIWLPMLQRALTACDDLRCAAHW